MVLDDGLLPWVQRFSGLEPQRVREGVSLCQAWDIPGVRQLSPDLESYVALTLLAESVRELVGNGVDERKVLSKLKNDPELWPTWAELRAAAIVTRSTQDWGVLELEATQRKGGKRPDFRLTLRDGTYMSIEFKAIGLSDAEFSFCQSAALLLDELLPPMGFVNLHSRIGAPFSFEDVDREFLMNQAVSGSILMPGFPEGLAAISVVGHGGEEGYLRRLTLRLAQEVAKQIPEGETGWAAFYWTNGAPVSHLLEHLDWDLVPTRIHGIILVGDAIVFPDANVHTFVHFLERGAHPEQVRRVKTSHNREHIRTTLAAVEQSSGVRAVLATVSEDGNVRALIRRDGSKRISPFILILDPDPGSDSLFYTSPTRDRERSKSL